MVKYLLGGFSENNLKAYSETANVTVNTNGLKTVTKNEDGSFSFSARKQEQNPVFRELVSKLQLELSQRLKQQVDLMENSFVWI